jgi:hypothetical protein
VTEVRIAGRAGETCYNTLLVRSISVVIKGLINYTSVGLVDRGTIGSYLLSNSARRLLEASDI